MRFSRRTARAASALVTLALGGGTAFVLAGSSGADVTDPVWNCRASPVWIEQDLLPIPQLGRIEPAPANGDASVTNPDRANCVDDDAGVPHIDIPGDPSIPINVAADAAYGRTRIEPDIAAARDQSLGSAAGIEKVKIDVADVLSIELNSINSLATAKCIAGVPTLAGASQVVGLKIEGLGINIPDLLNGEYVLIDLSPLVKLHFNRQIRTGLPASSAETLTQRAVQVEVLPTSTRPGVNLVLGETKVARRNAVCAPAVPPPTVTQTQTQVTTQTETQTHVDTVTSPPVTQTQTETSTSTVTTPPVTQTQTISAPNTTTPLDTGGNTDKPSGATVVDLGDVRGVTDASPCKRAKFGRQIGLVGTNGNDRVTGTNRSDRVFVRAGNDKVSAGRGNDCVEAGIGSDAVSGDLGFDYLIGDKGKDRLDGGPGPDRLYGDEGGDVLVGGSGNDRLYGGSGNDFIHTGFGKDRVYAGSGNDVINAATAGNRQMIYCGPGVDKVRMQRQDRAFDCERILYAR